MKYNVQLVYNPAYREYAVYDTNGTRVTITKDEAFARRTFDMTVKFAIFNIA